MLTFAFVFDWLRFAALGFFDPFDTPLNGISEHTRLIAGVAGAVVLLAAETTP